MKKTLLALGMGLVATASMAQTFPIKMGFENADKADWYHCKFANYVGDNQFGDWVNPNFETTTWLEQSADAAKNGEYGFFLQGAEKKNPWDRGFKLANVPIQEGKSYRMSFWIKGDEGKVLKAYLSKGVEQLDKSFVDPKGDACYGANGSDDYTLTSSDWTHVSFVAYNHGAQCYNDVLTNTAWMGGAVVGNCVPESLWEAAGINESNKDKTYREFWNGTIPEIYFAIINLYDEGSFCVDDILIEEDKYFAQATSDGFVIKLDFGYATNIASLATASKSGEFLLLDANQFTVKKGDEVLEIAQVEAQTDGYVYIWLNESTDVEGLTVSFTPAEDCPLQYGENKRPANNNDPMKVYGFENEVIYAEDYIEVTQHEIGMPELLSCVPENGSFDLSDISNGITMPFDMPIDATYSSVLDFDGDDMSKWEVKAGENNKTLVLNYDGTLKNGTYNLTLEVYNEAGNAAEVVYNFNLGSTAYDPEASVELMFDSQFEACNNGSFPNNGSMVSNKDGSIGTPGEGRGQGPRVFTDFAEGGQFTAALYLRDWEDGFYYRVGTREDEIIMAAPGKTNVSFTYCNWQGDSQNLVVDVFAVNDDNTEGETLWTNADAPYTKTINVAGGKAAVKNAPEVVIPITLEEETRIGVRIKGTGEYLIANVKIESIPDIAGVEYKSELWKAVYAAYDFYYTNDPTAYERYSESKEFEALYEIINKYSEDGNPTNWAEMGMTSPSQYKEATQGVKDATKAAQDYKTTIDTYDEYRMEGGKVAQLLAAIADTKIAQLECAKILTETFNTYKDQALTATEELKSATDIMVKNYILVRRWKGDVVDATGWAPEWPNNVGNIGLNALLYRIDTAIKTIETMINNGAEPDDNDIAVLEKAQAALTDDDNIANALKKVATKLYYKAMQNPDVKDEFFKEQWNEETMEQISDGTYDFSFFMKNPNIYIQTDNDQIAGSLEATNIGTEEEPVNVYSGAACPGWTFSEITGWSTWSTGWANYKSADVPVEAMASNWGGSYTISQNIEGLPAGLYNVGGAVNERDAFHEDSYFFVQVGEDGELITMPCPNQGQSWNNTPNLWTARRDGIWHEGNEITEDILDENGEVLVPGPGEEGPAADNYIEILDGKLTIGAHAGANDSHIFINKFGIKMVGRSANFNYADNDFWTGVESVKDNKVVSVAVYDINGRQKYNATKGMNIVKRVYSDGSVKVGKYLVK